MEIPGINRFRRTVRRIKKRFAPNGLILMYHSVNNWRSDPWSLCVTPEYFAEQLEVLQKYCFPMPLHQLVQKCQDGKIPHHAVTITFDDGYADNLHNAKPLLERCGIPATVFITTGYIGRAREFWWDELERLLLQPGTLPQTLCLTIRGNTHRWELDETAYYSKDDYMRHLGLKPWGGKEGSRYFLYWALWQLLQPLRLDEQQEVLDEITAWAGTQPIARPTHRPLMDEELSMLHRCGLIEIGAHTITHPCLSVHPVAFQQYEIQRNKAQLEDLLGCPVSSFAYPYGNYTPETIGLVQEAGFACACTTVKETVWRHTDCFQLPRVQVEDWNGDEFEKRLLRWFHG
jgi:peptidoglycan/xylan/chitin deacetylase (PgdA/CDA1 family)